LAGREPRLRCVAFAQNRGQSAAFCAGFDAALAPVVVTMDADLQNDPADVPRLLELFEQGHDMVIGWRAKRKDTLSKRLASKVGNAIRRRFTGDTVRDTGCSLKVMRRALLLELPRFKNMHRYLPALMQARGADVAEAPVNHRPRAHGQSKYGTWDRAVAGAWDLIGVRWLLARTLRWQERERSE
ncbi:MAG: glycosyltransferase, partial [Desulfovibrionaceae bacterium]